MSLCAFFSSSSSSPRPLRTLRGISSLVLLLCLLACSRQPADPTAAASPLRIAAAASLKPILPDLIGAFTKSHPAITVTSTYGASGNFYSQLVNAAPFDLFLSADTMYPQKLNDAGLTTAAPREYAAGRLVIWTPKTSGLDPTNLNIVTDPRVKKVAIANPAHAPYGRAAHKALEVANLLDAVKDKLVFGESVEQAATFARTGAAEIAILPRSQALASPMKDDGVFTDVPENLYEPIRHGAVIMRSSANAAAAESFLSFLSGPDGQAILGRAGLAAIKD